MQSINTKIPKSNETPDIKYFDRGKIITDYVIVGYPVDLYDIDRDSYLQYLLGIVYSQINCVIPNDYLIRVMIFYCVPNDPILGISDEYCLRWVYFPIINQVGSHKI